GRRTLFQASENVGETSNPTGESLLLYVESANGNLMIDASRKETRRVAVLGAPIDMGASQRGTLMGPAALRTAGLLTLLEALGFEVTDHGDLSVRDMADLT